MFSQGGRSDAGYPLLIISILFTLTAYELIPLIFTNGWQFARFLNQHDRPVALLAIVILAVAFYPFRDYGWIDRLLLWLAENPAKVAVVTAVVLGIASYFVYRHWPLTMDEYSPWFQAHVFASGSLYAQYPLDTLNHLFEKTYHNNFFVINWDTGRVVSSYWPGFALLLTPFAFLGVPWLCNPVIVSLSIIVLHRLAGRLGLTARQQGWVVLLAIASPAFTLNGMSFYSMPAHLLLNALFVLCLVKPEPARLFVAGLIGGYALSLHNPLPHLAFALPWLAWLVFAGEEKLKRTGLILAGYLPFTLLLVLGWVLLTRDIRHADQVPLLVDSASPVLAQHKPLLATLAGYFQYFTWPDIKTLAFRLGGFFKLWLWAVPLLVALAIIGIRRADSVAIRLLAASAMLTFFAYFLFPYSQGHGWGYRYFHSAWFTLPILAVAALKNTDISAAFTSRLAISALASLIVITPIRAWQMGDFVAGHLSQMPVAKKPKAANECEFVFHNRNGFYGIDMVENRPDLKGCRLTFLSRGFEQDMAFAQRMVPRGYEAGRGIYGWIYRYPAK